MNILCIIPARKNSKGIVNKNIKLINNKPLIFYTISKAKKSKLIDEIVVSSDSSKIRKLSQKYKINNFSLRPNYLATDKSTINKTLKYELRRIEKIKNKKFEIVILLQPTSPLRDNKIIDRSIRLFLKKINRFDSLMTISKFDEPSPFKTFIFKKRNLKKLINFKTKNDTTPRQYFPDVYIPNGIVYIFKRINILKKENILGNKIFGYKINSDYINIDNEKDLILAKKLIKK